MVMGALRTDREERSTGSSQHHRLARDMPYDHAALGKIPERDPLGKIGSVAESGGATEGRRALGDASASRNRRFERTLGPSAADAGWHISGDLVVPENLSLVFLPPYSPELNPIERLWLHLRDNRLSHCVFQTTGEIVDTCCDAWNWLLGQTGRIRSLCSYPCLKPVSD